MDRKFQFIKFLASALLILSFFLPMSSCSYTVSPRSGVVEDRVVLNYPREYLDLDEVGGWLNILAFHWPIGILLLQWRFSGRKYSYLLTCSGVLLAAFSAVAVYTWADIGKPLIGAYVGGGAAVALFVIYVGELVGIISKYAGRRTQRTNRM